MTMTRDLQMKKDTQKKKGEEVSEEVGHAGHPTRLSQNKSENNFVVLYDSKRDRNAAAPCWVPRTVDSGKAFVAALDLLAGTGKRCWTIDQAVRSLSSVEEASREMLLVDTILCCCGSRGKHGKRVLEKGGTRVKIAPGKVEAEEVQERRQEENIDVVQEWKEQQEQEAGLSKGYLLLSAYEKLNASQLSTSLPSTCRYTGRMQSKQPMWSELFARFLFDKDSSSQLRPCRLLLKCLTTIGTIGSGRATAAGVVSGLHQPGAGPPKRQEHPEQQHQQQQQLMLVGRELQALLSVCADPNPATTDCIELAHRLAIAFGFFRELDSTALASHASETELTTAICWLVQRHASCNKIPLDAAADMLGVVKTQDPLQCQRLSAVLFGECRRAGFATKKINRIRGQLGMEESVADSGQQFVMPLAESSGRQHSDGPLPALSFAEQGVPVVYVDTLVKLAALEAEVRESCIHADSKTSKGDGGRIGRFRILGMDVEWEPDKRPSTRTRREASVTSISSSAPQQHPASIVQLAAPHVVLIIDMLRLYEADNGEVSKASELKADCDRHYCPSSTVRTAIQKFFATVFNTSVVIGFGLETDIRRLQTSFSPALVCFDRVPRVLDLRRFAKPAKSHRMSSKSLSSLVEDHLGRSLDKAQQLSRWGSRPLGQQQLDYAALDAFVLLLLAARACTIEPIWPAGAVGEAGSEEAGAEEESGQDGKCNQGISANLAAAFISESGDLHHHLDSMAVPLELAHPTTRMVSAQHSADGRKDDREIFEPLGTDEVIEALRKLGMFQDGMIRDISSRCSSEDPPIDDNAAEVVVKTIVLVVDTLDITTVPMAPTLVACVLPLTRKLQMDRVRTALSGVLSIKATSKIRLCKHNELVRFCGYPHGAIGPVGLRTSPAAILLDESITSSTILCGAGKGDIVFATSPQSLITSAGAQRAVVSA
jgi:prolyl-tRNA editing enzyme YbaK/EbsC (Cys-tRNA(Pro) deacylase)